MADVTTLLRRSTLNREITEGAFIDEFALPIASGAAANGDRIQLSTVTRNSRLMLATMAVSATLGAGCTLKLQRDRAGVYTDLTGATTAAAASIVNSAALGCFDLNEGDVITALVGGANIAAAATLNVDLLLQAK